MKFAVCLVLFLFLSNSFSQNVSPQFSELKGMGDQSANTHLFYRIHTYFANDPIYEWTNHIYHLDIFAEIDTLFITASGFESPGYNFNKWVSDFDFWNNNPAEFIYCGGSTGGPFMEGQPYVVRFDGVSAPFPAFHGSANYIDISSTDDSLLYLGVFMSDLLYGEWRTFSSIDGGWNWEMITDSFQFQSLYPINDNILFAVDGNNSQLNKSTNSGNSFYLVDPESYWDSRFFYDNDGMHVYRVINSKLKVSDNIGEQFSWETKYSLTAGDKFYVSLDYSNSGTIYLANKKNIFISANYGDNFNLYKTLDRKIVGIYKKPNSDKLYAATKYKIYEITPDTIQVIKSLPIPDEVLNYYPLAVGNKWVYDYIIDPDDPGLPNDAGIYIREVLKDTILANGNLYAKLYDETLNYFAAIIYERVDSSSGKVYRYYEDPTLENNEYVIHDLLAEIEDTITSSRNNYGESLFTTVQQTGTFKKWGITKPKKIYQEYSLLMLTYSLTQEVGLDSLYFIFDFGYGRTDLKGTILNGTVYGDTTVVSVEDETPNLPTEFSLSQNYPNPFNPSTAIRFTIPSNVKRETSNVTLKVYDILGREIATLVNEEKSAGSYEVEFDATNLSSGVYFYQLRAGGFVDTKKLILIK